MDASHPGIDLTPSTWHRDPDRDEPQRRGGHHRRPEGRQDHSDTHEKKKALCDAVRTCARQALSAAQRGSVQDAIDCHATLLKTGERLLGSASGKHVRKALGAALETFRNATSERFTPHNLQQFALSCSIISQQFDRIIGAGNPPAKAKPPTKLAISTFVLGHARIVASLVTSGRPRSGLAREVQQLTDKLIRAGEDMSANLSGRHKRSAISTLLRDFKQALSQPADPKDPGKIADICLNFAARLDDIVGISRPDNAYRFAVRS